jgi:hypothetical protein
MIENGIPNCIADAPVEVIETAKEIAIVSLNTIRNIIDDEFPTTEPEARRDFVTAICFFMVESQLEKTRKE